MPLTPKPIPLFADDFHFKRIVTANSGELHQLAGELGWEFDTKERVDVMRKKILFCFGKADIKFDSGSLQWSVKNFVPQDFAQPAQETSA
jgi:hypothetical protein